MKHYIWAFLWAIFVFILIAMPGSGNPGIPFFEGMDKLVHVGFFFVLTVLMLYGAIRRRNNQQLSIGTTAIIIVISLLFAGFTEWVQLQFFTYRSADIWDLFSDVVGTGMGVFSYLIFHKAYQYEKK